ncbi:MAG: hypothetical protein AAGC57_17695 [Pseudomonadota bacterium]
MSAPSENRRGGAPVGCLSELPPVEAAAVVYLRLWCSGGERQAEVWNSFAIRFGSSEGARRLKAFERLMATITDAARRPIMRHQLDCSCVGADEAIFANLVAAAASGASEDAVLFAALLVHPHMAAPVVAEARLVGQSLSAMAANGSPAPQTSKSHRFTHAHSPTRH